MTHQLFRDEQIKLEELEKLVTSASMIHSYKMMPNSQLFHFMFFNVIQILFKRMSETYDNATLNKLLTATDDATLTIAEWRKRYEMVWQRAEVYFRTQTFITEIMRCFVMPILYNDHFVLALVCRYNQRSTMVFDSLREDDEIAVIRTPALLKYVLLLEKFIMALEMLDMNLDEVSLMSRQAVEPFRHHSVRSYGIRQETCECGLFVATGLLRLADSQRLLITSYDDLFKVPMLMQNEYISMVISYIAFHRFFGYIRKMKITNPCEIVLINVSPCKEEVALTSMISTALNAIIKRAEIFLPKTPITFLNMNDEACPTYEMRVRRLFIVVGSRDPTLGMTKLANKEIFKEYLEGSQIRLVVYPGQCVEVFERPVDAGSDAVAKQRYKIMSFYHTYFDQLNYLVPLWASSMRRDHDEMPQWSNSLVDHCDRTICLGLPPLSSRHVITTVRTGSVPI